MAFVVSHRVVYCHTVHNQDIVHCEIKGGRVEGLVETDVYNCTGLGCRFGTMEPQVVPEGLVWCQ